MIKLFDRKIFVGTLIVLVVAGNPGFASGDLSPIAGPPDLIEQGVPNSRPVPRAGSMLITHAADSTLCRSLIKKGTRWNTNYSSGNDRIEEERLGTRIPDADWGAIAIHPNVIGDTESVGVQQLDLTNTGVAQQVYLVNSGHTFTLGFFVIPPATVSIDQLIEEFSVERDFTEIPGIARKKGWLVLGWNFPPYHTTPFQFSVVKAAKATYLLGYSESPASAQSELNPTAVLWKGLPNGTLKQVCVFQIVKPHPGDK